MGPFGSEMTYLGWSVTYHWCRAQCGGGVEWPKICQRHTCMTLNLSWNMTGWAWTLQLMEWGKNVKNGLCWLTSPTLFWVPTSQPCNNYSLFLCSQLLTGTVKCSPPSLIVTRNSYNSPQHSQKDYHQYSGWLEISTI